MLVCICDLFVFLSVCLLACGSLHMTCCMCMRVLCVCVSSCCSVFKKACNPDHYSFADQVNFLVADGHKFAHPLSHLGKTTRVCIEVISPTRVLDYLY